MREYGFHNWDGGEVTIETIVTEIIAYARNCGVRCVDLVGRVDLAVVAAIQKALVGEVTAMNPELTSPVQSKARVVMAVTAYSAPGVDGSRRQTLPSRELPVNATVSEVEKVAEELREVAAAKLGLPLGKFSRVV